ncbi:SMP-30/gluconolactonase/LRE family protein [Ramlibacter sp. G-1-2-2]|uniref:SMP-30/gluconolactonase/LRE family protein n=1 Tax=Ramlibacter agri TaxID=2728837 RepID=A0A848GWN1_9BURK|nr:SMP-30/gluconolactonase/LRE family protein [Ramlibacter agri]NML43066.1 SMP-30/gluconolactonase/LRE family protein [Ramlibacter agri]
MTRISVLSPHRDLLGECPLWDVRTESLVWIDGRGQRVHRQHLATGARASWQASAHIGSIALCESGRVLLALEDGFAFLDPASGGITPWGPTVTHRAGQMRLNDGRVDRQGRFVVGSMTVGRREPLGAFYQLDGRGRLLEIERDIHIANATCFSPDGRWLYLADSVAQQIWRYAYDSEAGTVGPREILVDKDALGKPPDGATVDAEGCLWVAVIRDGRLARFDASGRSLQSIPFEPESYITCPCFGGPEFGTLFVTSISDSGHLFRSTNPQAGAVFRVDGTGVRGLEEPRFKDL